LLDLREDWGLLLLDEHWAWNKGAVPPLRLLVEFGALVARAHLGLRASSTKPICISKTSEECLDWSRTLPLFQPRQEGPLDLVLPSELKVYFGWHWDQADTCNVSIATKADDAEVDLSLWNVGGHGVGME
jgi:hypothetical protein